MLEYYPELKIDAIPNTLYSFQMHWNNRLRILSRLFILLVRERLSKCELQSPILLSDKRLIY